MQKCLIAALICSFSFLLISCTKTQHQNEEDVQYLRLENIKTLQFLEQRKVAYSLLSSEEKATLWKEHLVNINSVVRFNSNQVKIIREALNFLKKENFDNSSKFWKSNEFEIWKYKVSKAFDDKEKAKLFNDVRTIGTKEFSTMDGGGIGTIDDDPIPKCECNSSGNGDFCGNMNYGDVFTGIYTFKCGPTSTCGQSTSGCGWFWYNSCNGKCNETFTKGVL